MSTYVKPDFEVMAFLPNEYVSACDGSVSANVSCEAAGVEINLTNGTHQGHGLYNFGSLQLYTDIYKQDDNGNLIKDDSIFGVLVGSIYDGHNADASQQPRLDGEYSAHESAGLIYPCTHSMTGADGKQVSPYQHHHLDYVSINNHST